VSNDKGELLDVVALRQLRGEIGGGFARILGYFREDGAASVARIEDAIGKGDSAALVLPAHTLKGESRQFGASRLAAAAEYIEMTARRLLEQRRDPEALVAEVEALRPLFEATLAAIDREAGPPPAATARPVFGRRAAPAAQFGRA
jgi:HPt (histidine-containing phosphotransfer) domain-containing protein